jgi:hypothetical protein
VCELSFGGDITRVRKGFGRNCRHHDLEALNHPVPPPSHRLAHARLPGVRGGARRGRCFAGRLGPSLHGPIRPAGRTGASRRGGARHRRTGAPCERHSERGSERHSERDSERHAIERDTVRDPRGGAAIAAHNQLDSFDSSAHGLVRRGRSSLALFPCIPSSTLRACLRPRRSRVSFTVSRTASRTASVSPSLPLCLLHRVSHCVSHRLCLTVSLPPHSA